MTSTDPAAPSPLSRLTRLTDRGMPDRAALDAFLDSQLLGTLSTVLDGEPWVVPLLFARDGDRILLHGSSGAGALRQVAAGAPAAFCVAVMDGLVVAESTFESSANYRSAVIRGCLETTTGVDKSHVLQRISERIIPGRHAEVGPSTRREEAATLGLSLRIEDGNWLMKERRGGPGEPPEPVSVWCGVVPLRTVADAPQPASWSVGPVPPSVLDFVRARPVVTPAPQR